MPVCSRCGERSEGRFCPHCGVLLTATISDQGLSKRWIAAILLIVVIATASTSILLYEHFLASVTTATLSQSTSLGEMYDVSNWQTKGNVVFNNGIAFLTVAPGPQETSIVSKNAYSYGTFRFRIHFDPPKTAALSIGLIGEQLGGCNQELKPLIGFSFNRFQAGGISGWTNNPTCQPIQRNALHFTGPGPSLGEGWHIFELTWKTGQALFYIDGQALGGLAENIPSVPMHISISLFGEATLQSQTVTHYYSGSVVQVAFIKYSSS